MGVSRSPAPAAPSLCALFTRSPSPATVVYPTDYNGNYCGKSGTSVEGLPYAHFAKLDEDIKAQKAVLASGQWWNFVPYTICVDECPEKFSIVGNTTYGGCDCRGVDVGSGQPCDPEDNEEFYAAFKTKQMLKRCFPVLEKTDAASRTLCAVPACDDAKGIPCLDPQPEAGDGTPTGTTWLARLAGL